MPRSAATEPPVIRVQGTADLVASVPYLVGFTPRRSVVVVSLRGPRLRCGMVARVDLPPPDLERGVAVDAVVASLVPPLVRDEPRRVAVVVHDERPWDHRRRPHQDVVDELEDAFAAHGVLLEEAAYVGAERFWSYTCQADGCCPVAGRPLDALRSGVVPASFVAQGRAPLADREALTACVQPRGPLVTAAVGSVAAREARWRGTDRRATALAQFETLLHRRVTGAGGATADEAGRLVAALTDVEVRDAVAQRHCGWLGDLAAGGHRGDDDGPLDPGEVDPVTDVLRDLATSCDGEWAVAPLTLLALQHWDAGDGALANACLERVLAIDPVYRMAVLAEQLLRAGVPPRWADARR